MIRLREPGLERLAVGLALRERGFALGEPGLHLRDLALERRDAPQRLVPIGLYLEARGLHPPKRVDLARQGGVLLLQVVDPGVLLLEAHLGEHLELAARLLDDLLPLLLGDLSGLLLEDAVDGLRDQARDQGLVEDLDLPEALLVEVINRDVGRARADDLLDVQSLRHSTPAIPTLGGVRRQVCNQKAEKSSIRRAGPSNRARTASATAPSACCRRRRKRTFRECRPGGRPEGRPRRGPGKSPGKGPGKVRGRTRGWAAGTLRGRYRAQHRGRNRAQHRGHHRGRAPQGQPGSSASDGLLRLRGQLSRSFSSSARRSSLVHSARRPSAFFLPSSFRSTVAGVQVEVVERLRVVLTNSQLIMTGR